MEQKDGKIVLRNPSFEDSPGASKIPRSWMTVGLGSTPDIMPGAWGVAGSPQEGASFLALVTRSDGTVEDIAQRLSSPLVPGVCYTFSIYLAHSPRYVGHDLPVRLRIWGGKSPAKQFLLCSSEMVSHSDWRKYTFQFVPKSPVQYLVLEAYYAPGVFKPYRGNILLDNCSPIERCERA
ncbi:MAG: hypothetical protein NZM43_04535 [Saprospiraceae bacterium]|nr:hypothetical protein [Saprospiraceae bacterium]MDW8483576.1 hypothetical protein [Saprospiraceae bacterium]